MNSLLSTVLSIIIALLVLVQQVPQQSLLVSALPSLPVIDFTNQPLNNTKVIALTFNDGPDLTYTQQIIDLLNTRHIVASFAINGNNYVDLATSSVARSVVSNMSLGGHDIIDQTLNHKDMLTMTPEAIQSSCDSMQSLMDSIFGKGKYPLYMGRAPYGSAYAPAYNQSQRLQVHKTFGMNRMHIGWSMDSNDASGCNTTECLTSTVQNMVNKGSWGIMLFNSVLPWTVAAMPSLLDYLTAQGFTFVTVSKVVQAKYGMTPAEIYNSYRLKGKRISTDTDSSMWLDDGKTVGSISDPTSTNSAASAMAASTSASICLMLIIASSITILMSSTGLF